MKYTVKKVSDFPVPSRDVAKQTLPGREYCILIIPDQWEFGRPVWLVTSRLGTGKSQTFFYSVPATHFHNTMVFLEQFFFNI